MPTRTTTVNNIDKRITYENGGDCLNLKYPREKQTLKVS